MSNQSHKEENYKLPKGLATGIKRTRGKPILHDERKVNLNITLTPKAREFIKLAAQAQGVSMSELIEQWARTTLNESEV